jgi:LuxR family maltose regulon positive regulatory protein
MIARSLAGGTPMAEARLAAGQAHADAPSVVPAGVSPALLAGKLGPPPLGFPPLSRPRLSQVLSRGVAVTPVTLLSGPAGSGKTVLASLWAQTHHRRPVAWLSLDDADDDPAVFWRYLVAALERAGIGLPVGAPGLTAGESAPKGWPVWLAAALATLRREVVLVIDNADSLTCREVTDALDLLVHYAGERLRLVLCARADPLLPLHRYRLHDLITEIRADELAFTAEETGALLSSLGTPVSAAAAAALTEQTEGWAAALRLAAAPLARGMDPADLVASLTAYDGSITQYLVAEVLDHQPATVRRFLLRASATHEFWPELVDTLAGRPGGCRILASLAAVNAFVERAAGAPGGFRIHALFRELLQAQLAYEDPRAFATGHRICADWYAAAGELPAAVEHARVGGEPELAARLLIDDLAVARLLADGSTGGTQQVDGGGPDAAVLRSAVALASDRPAAFADLTVAAAVAGDPRARPAARVCAAVVCAVAAAADPRGRAAGTTAETAEALIAALPDRQAQRRAEFTAVLAAREATALLATSVPERALRESLARALAAARAAYAPRLSAICLAELALLEALLGRVRRATKLAADYEALADDGRLLETERSPAAATAAAWAAVDRHDLSAARSWLGRAARRTLDPRISGPLCAVVDSRLRRARGELDTADQTLHPALDDPALPDWVREHVLTEAIRIRLARRDGPAAEALLDRLPAGSPRDRLLRATAAALGLPPAAGRAFPAPGVDDIGGPLPLGLAVEDAVVRACMLADAGNTATSVATLAHALELAAPERLRRPFLDAPPGVRRLLRIHPPLTTASAWLDPTAPAVPVARRPAEAITGSPAPQLPSTLIGELSPREMEVLRLLAELLSTTEIAAALFVSINTVRTHIRSILRKLGAGRRNEAVRRARELQLIGLPVRAAR